MAVYDKYRAPVQRRAPIQTQQRGSQGPSAEERRIDMLIQAGLGILGAGAETAFKVGAQEGGWAHNLMTPEDTLREQAARRRMEREFLGARTAGHKMETAMAPVKTAADLWYKTQFQPQLEEGRMKRHLATEAGATYRVMLSAEENKKLARLKARLRKRGQRKSGGNFLYDPQTKAWYSEKDLNSAINLQGKLGGTPGGGYFPTARENTNTLVSLRTRSKSFKSKKALLDAHPEAGEGLLDIKDIPADEQSLPGHKKPRDTSPFADRVDRDKVSLLNDEIKEKEARRKAIKEEIKNAGRDETSKKQKKNARAAAEEKHAKELKALEGEINDLKDDRRDIKKGKAARSEQQLKAAEGGTAPAPAQTGMTDTERTKKRMASIEAELKKVDAGTMTEEEFEAKFKDKKGNPLAVSKAKQMLHLLKNPPAKK